MIVITIMVYAVFILQTVAVNNCFFKGCTEMKTQDGRSAMALYVGVLPTKLSALPVYPNLTNEI